MKTKIWVVLLLLMASLESMSLLHTSNDNNGFQNTPKIDSCKATKVFNMLVTYKHLHLKSDFPAPYKYEFKTTLFINDSVAQYVYKREEKVFRIANYRITAHKHYYVNDYYFKKDLMRELRILDEGKIYAEWKPEYQWEITDDTKTIKGYTVRKAVTNSIEVEPGEPGYNGKVYAWFTEEIPLPVGPDRYVGLPGLILEIEYENTNIKTTLESIQNNVDYKLVNTKQGVRMDDKLDVIYFYHKHPRLVRKALKKAQQQN